MGSENVQSTFEVYRNLSRIWEAKKIEEVEKQLGELKLEDERKASDLLPLISVFCPLLWVHLSE